MVRRRLLARTSLVGVAVVLVLSLAVYLTLGTRWGFETYLFPYLVAASLVPLASTLVAGRYGLAVPSLVLAAGVTAFVVGVTWTLVCEQTTTGGWRFTFDSARTIIRFGPTLGGAPACRTEPNAPLAVLGYLLTTAGSLQLLDGITAGEWFPLDAVSSLGDHEASP